MMTKDIEGDNGFWNLSNCFLDTTANIDIFKILNIDIENNTLYIRFFTKNLEVEFDWFDLIACEFKEFMPLTSKAQENIAKAQQYTARVQENTGCAQRYTEEAQLLPAEAQQYTAWVEEYKFEAQEYIASAQEYTAKAQQTIQQLQSINQPKNITINLTQKTVNDYKTNSTKQVSYFELRYDLDELVNFINKLDLSNKPHLQKVRQFVNNFAKKPNNPSNLPTVPHNGIV